MGATEHEQYNHMLSMSDGNSVTAREWSQIKLAEFGWVLLLEPVTGKELGFFRFKTDSAWFAGVLERKIQKAKTPVCAVEGCACGADKCQMHHIESWASGGPTTMGNMTMLCPFHNGHNDDNPARPCYGRIEKDQRRGLLRATVWWTALPQHERVCPRRGHTTRPKTSRHDTPTRALKALHSFCRQALLAQLIHLRQLQGRQFGDLAADRPRQ